MKSKCCLLTLLLTLEIIPFQLGFCWLITKYVSSLATIQQCPCKDTLHGAQFSPDLPDHG